ncbi:MAG: hypothetical protein BWK76_05385 [Desulfobulbaceae bacterium A2]|nr:MAG: hypothetical protein BWK76_05385 [Desulfobulbaceae bacterium A2]
MAAGSAGSVQPPTVHRAPWVLPVLGPAIADGAVAVANGRILAVDTSHRLRHTLGAGVDWQDHAGCVLTPALVNAHCHLELSHLADLGREAPAGFCDWILRVIAERGRATAQEATTAALAALAAMRGRGIGLVGDIGNSGMTTDARFADPALCCFHEFLGFSAQGAQRALATLAALPPQRDISAHAPYSTAESLLLALCRRARQQDRVLPIHLAESPEEMEFFVSGGGPVRDLLLQRGVWKPDWRPPAQGNPIRWLDHLGLLDEKLLCVHVVQAQAPEVELLARRRARLCLCPGSNQALGVGRPPLPAYLAAGLLPALGTDSLASNPQLCLWHEMALLRRDHPGVEPATVFAMATQAGARALEREGDWGALVPGRRARFLAVPLPVAAGGAAEVLEFLTSGDEAIVPGWIG